MLSVKHAGIKYHFLNFLYDSTRDWTPVSRTFSELSTHKANGPEVKTLYDKCMNINVQNDNDD